MTYFFILGSHPLISQAEIMALFPQAKEEILANHVFLLTTDQKIDARELIRQLGGTIKIGLVDGELKDFRKLGTLERIKKIIDPIIENMTSKFNFGFSDYANSGRINFSELGMETKKYLKENGINCRWVVSREKILSSVVVEQNKLISHGIEIVFIAKSKQVLVGHTLAVQPFKELSYRDYGRPQRDDLSGMLPPKLAQMMINLSQAPKDGTILDPFCGSGTVLTEALLLGYQNIIGSDISEKAIIDTDNNVKWIKDKFKIDNKKIETFKLSATELTKKIKPNTIDAIITEPYLGPQRGNQDINKTIAELEELYSQSIKEFKQILKPQSTVVMIWPMFLTRNNNRQTYLKINPDINGFEKNKEPLIYGRAGQKVWREIVILKN
jgi:tRNA (guanine10-N2)-dimethyltransferase